MKSAMKAEMAPGLREKLTRARGILAGLKSAAVAFSGGVDSGLVLALAHAELGQKCVAVTALSPSLPPEEVEEVKAFAGGLGVRHLFVKTEEVTNKGYRKNPENRCFICKTEIYGEIRQLADREGLSALVDGAIAADFAGDRPGLIAGEQAGVVSPLALSGFQKDDVREAARQLGLPSWDKPAMACLSSRFAYGVEIDEERLQQVAAAETALRKLGFSGVRVRYHGALARIELPRAEVARAATPEVRSKIVSELLSAGFSMITLDLMGYREGGLPQ
ncbi:MAG: ATP-dependent sacrificial sulfur transferase LarE [Planctomycetota bacterium]|jgi:uncharacterized protein